jgi:hypothetical protein
MENTLGYYRHMRQALGVDIIKVLDQFLQELAMQISQWEMQDCRAYQQRVKAVLLQSLLLGVPHINNMIH